MNKDLTTLFTGHHRISLDLVESTNSYLSECLKTQVLKEGTVVQAKFQETGRGQAGTQWHSESAENLLLSFIFYPSFLKIKDIFQLNIIYSLGIYDYVSNRLGHHVKIKWPNDIYWRKFKLGGILIENSLSTSGITHSILGVGLNINQEVFPSSLPNPVSLYLVQKKKSNLETEFSQLCSCIESRYLQLKRGEQKVLIADYNQALYRLNEWQMYSGPAGKFKGRITGVNQQGLLLVEHLKGQVKSYDLKEIKFL